MTIGDPLRPEAHPRLKGGEGTPRQARASTLLTDFAYHRPPRGVLMPRAFNASAI